MGLLPKMYGGRHEVWISPEPLSEFLRAEPGRAPFDVTHDWVNHYPARYLRFDTAREAVKTYTAPAWVRLESSYRGETMTSTYTVQAVAGHLEVRRDVRPAP